MAAYLGPLISAEQFMLRPVHSILAQARAPQETCYTKVNADGYGMGWYDAEGDPALYRSALPMWADSNLPYLARSLESDVWLANVRSATGGLSTGIDNTQPFLHEDLLFMHNGFIRQFREVVRPALHRFLAPDIQADIRGDTDSEYLFALLRHLLTQDEELSIEEAMATLFEVLGQWLDELPAMLNLLVCDGESLYAARHAVNEVCPSLYYTTDDEAFPGAQLIASERLTDSDYWTAVPEHALLILHPESPPELLEL
jgi:glutamine amidotransferase